MTPTTPQAPGEKVRFIIAVKWRNAGLNFWDGYAYVPDRAKARRYKVAANARRISEQLQTQWVAKGRPVWKVEAQ